MMKDLSGSCKNSELTPETGDYGADLVLSKDGRKIVVQAKRWKNVVGIEAVQQCF